MSSRSQTLPWGWMYRYVYWDAIKKDTLLLFCNNIEKPVPLKIHELIENSEKFLVQFPIETCRIKSQPKERYPAIEEQAASAYPIIQENAFLLFINFLSHKQKYGSAVEKEIYENMKIPQFVQRLLTKRCLSFYGRKNRYMALSGSVGNERFKSVGTDEEEDPLNLKNFLSHDEIQLSNLISVSSHSDFLNLGNKNNFGRVKMNKENIEKCGVIINVNSPHFQTRGVFEFKDMVVTNQNVPSNGYGQVPRTFSNLIEKKNFDFRRIWNEYYDDKGMTYKYLPKKDTRYKKILNKAHYIDCKRMAIYYSCMISKLFLDANARAKAVNKMAYIHIDKFGLDKWKIDNQWQEEIFLGVCERVIMALYSVKLHNIFAINFYGFEPYGKIKHDGFVNTNDICDPYFGNKHPNQGIRIYFSKREPFEKLPEFKDEVVLVVAYSGDGNAYPGNEFWMKKLSISGAAAITSGSLISELHNPLINTTMVSGNNLHISTDHGGIIHISEFVSRLTSCPESFFI